MQGRNFQAYSLEHQVDYKLADKKGKQGDTPFSSMKAILKKRTGMTLKINAKKIG